MKAIEFTRYGRPHEVCHCIEVADPPDPNKSEITIAVEAAAINPADLLILEGRYPGPKPPARQGIEGVGKVIAIGENVTALKIGDRAMLLGRDNWVEQQTMPASQAIKIPEDLNILQAAQIKANPPSAMIMLENYENLNEGDWVIQNAANSAVGLHVIRLARSRGIRSVNVVRREALIKPLKDHGADLVVLEGSDLSDRVREEIGEARMPLAIDAIGGISCMNLADCITNGGTVVNYGFLSGDPCMLTPTHTIVRQIKLVGFWLATSLFAKSHDVIKATYTEIAQMFIDGVLYSPVEATYTLDRVTEALEHAGRAQRSGKIIFTPNGPIS